MHEPSAQDPFPPEDQPQGTPDSRSEVPSDKRPVGPWAKRWRAWQQYTARERWAFVLAWWVMPWVWLALKLLDLRRLAPLMMPATVSRAAAPGMNLASAQRLGEAVNRAARWSPFPATCLTRSLVLGWMLRRRGLACNLCIGVQMNAGALHAHAWVECDGIPVNDRAQVAADFAPFDGLGRIARLDP